MPRPPSVLIIFSTPLGVLAGSIGLAALGWLAVGLPLSSPQLLVSLEKARWPALGSRTPGAPLAPAPSPGTAIQPLLFATSVGAGATPEVSATLRGIAKGPKDQAALIAVGDGPAGWLALGQARDGITLVSIDASKVVIDTALGFRTIELDKPKSTLTAGPALDHRP